jgi:hypothetical protein
VLRIRSFLNKLAQEACGGRRRKKEYKKLKQRFCGRKIDGGINKYLTVGSIRKNACMKIINSDCDVVTFVELIPFSSKTKLFIRDSDKFVSIPSVFSHNNHLLFLSTTHNNRIPKQTFNNY